jgi:hypothetical protein
MTTKFYKTIIQIEILSEDEPYGEGQTLGDINYAITEGHCSGKITTISQDEVHASTMAQLLIAQGSDPEFFMIDKNGEPINEN